MQRVWWHRAGLSSYWQQVGSRKFINAGKPEICFRWMQGTLQEMKLWWLLIGLFVQHHHNFKRLLNKCLWSENYLYSLITMSQKPGMQTVQEKPGRWQEVRRSHWGWESRNWRMRKKNVNNDEALELFHNKLNAKWCIHNYSFTLFGKLGGFKLLVLFALVC